MEIAESHTILVYGESVLARESEREFTAFVGRATASPISFEKLELK